MRDGLKVLFKVVDRLADWLEVFGRGEILWCRCLYHAAGTLSAAGWNVGIGPVYGIVIEYHIAPARCIFQPRNTFSSC